MSAERPDVRMNMTWRTSTDAVGEGPGDFPASEQARRIGTSHASGRETTQEPTGDAEGPTASVDVARVRVEPGDVVVLSTRWRLSTPAVRALEARLKTVFPDNQCVVLDSGAELAVVTPTRRRWRRRSVL